MLKAESVFDIRVIIIITEMEAVPDELVINWYHTGIN